MGHPCPLSGLEQQRTAGLELSETFHLDMGSPDDAAFKHRNRAPLSHDWVGEPSNGAFPVAA